MCFAKKAYVCATDALERQTWPLSIMADGVAFALQSKWVKGKWCMCLCTMPVRLVNEDEDGTGLYPNECGICNMTWQQCDAKWQVEAAKMLAEEKEKMKEYEEKKKEKEEKEAEKAKKKDDFPGVDDIDGCTVTAYTAFQWVRRAYENDPSKWDPATCGGPTPKDCIHIFCASYQLIDGREKKTKCLNYIRNKSHDEVIQGLKDILKIFHDEAPPFATLDAGP